MAIVTQTPKEMNRRAERRMPSIKTPKDKVWAKAKEMIAEIEKFPEEERGELVSSIVQHIDSYFGWT